MKRYFLFAALSLSVIVVAMAFVKKENEYPDKHLEIVLRNIGHEVLLRSKDSTSRVLPVRALNENTFRISFDNRFEFIPDTLMNLVHQQLAKTGRQDYTVSVNECDQNETVFAYEVTKTGDDLKPCRGREQKKDCYVIDISFPPKRSFNYGWLTLAFVPIGVTGFYFARRRNKISEKEEIKNEKPEAPPEKDEQIEIVDDHKMIGNFIFSPSKETLSIDGDIIELSVKESKALGILVANENQVVARDLLMKEIWEEDGVVVIARNVDVLMSKLRKKLSADPDIRIVNVHGKGYKMVV